MVLNTHLVIWLGFTLILASAAVCAHCIFMVNTRHMGHFCLALSTPHSVTSLWQLEMAVMGIFTTQKLPNATNRAYLSFFLPPGRWLLNPCQHTTVYTTHTAGRWDLQCGLLSRKGKVAVSRGVERVMDWFSGDLGACPGSASSCVTSGKWLTLSEPHL